MLKIKFLFLLVVVCLTPLVSAFGWDDVGHKTVAFIAWQKMTPQAREQAIKVLRGAPEDSTLGAYFMSDSRSLAARQLDYFMLSATWADSVRDRDFKVRIAKYQHGPWHYLDTFWRDANGKPELVTGLEDGKENAVERLFFFDKSLRDAATTNEDKALALAWILHLVGDIHQPLHASGRVTAEEPKGDQGGNLFVITPKDAPNKDSLHWFWDSIIVRNIPRGDSCDDDYIPNIANQIVKSYPESNFASRLDLGKFDSWQQESYRIASTKVYPATLKRNEMPSDDYKKMALQVSEEQIALAGYRLGAMLNQVFGGATATATAAVSNPTEKCQVIRKVAYPVTQTMSRTNPQTMEICLLNLCPPNRGMLARPTITVTENGQMTAREYDVAKVFKSKAEAQDFAGKNGISDISF